ncbi:MAG TPA: DedA family protein [Vicinamibacterales bacterium]|nr:DedA family protein [Vicinamibacterales bacterium]
MPDWLLDLFARYGYAVVFFGVFLENTGLPVPGETALLAGAALSHFGRLELPWVVVTAVAGAVLGDNLGFLIGHHYGRGLIERYGSHVGLTAARLAEFDRFFLRHGGRTVFIARFITGLRVFGAMLAGASGLRWPTFLFYNAAGALSWSLAIAAAGYSLAYSWATLERWIGRSGLVGLALVVAIVVIGLLRRRKQDP